MSEGNIMQAGDWYNAEAIKRYSYTCGYCGTLTAPSRHYRTVNHGSDSNIGRILICAHCNKPTYLSGRIQVPGPIIGKDVNHVPQIIAQLYNEARKCITVGAYTSAVLACRKILMNVAVQEGAEEDKSFHYYVDYLESNNYLPPKGRTWVDKIRQKGNEATHEIHPMSLNDATQIIGFTELLLRFIYEFPATVEKV
jgi:hypothetical protein